jgi:hypothetical protein
MRPRQVDGPGFQLFDLPVATARFSKIYFQEIKATLSGSKIPAIREESSAWLFSEPPLSDLVA